MMQCKGVAAALVAFEMTAGLARGEVPFNVTCTRPSHLYAANERAEFEITSPTGGVRIVAKLSRAYLPTLETVVTTTPARVSYGLGEPGFVVCEVWGADADGKPTGDSRLAGAGFEPSRLRTAWPRPKDYDRFWEEAFREQDSIPPDFTSRPVSNGVELVSCRTVWGTRMYGFLKLPKGKGPFPLQITVGGGDSYFCEEAALGRVAVAEAKDCAILLIQLPGWDPSVPTWKEARERNRGWLEANGIPNGSLIYWNCEKGPRERWYYRCILGACRLIEYAAKRAEIDRSRVYYYGASTGGGYGIFLAAFSPHIRAAICEVPNYGNMSGPAVGRPSGEDDRGRYWKTSIYYDGAYCAPRIKCPIFVSCGYWDQCCCPETVYCIYNEIRAPKVMFDKVDNGHGDFPKGYVEKRAAWLKEQFQVQTMNLKK